ncbi:cysteine proteinase [Xylariaceae sp. FL0662B]|nr:cysteine proteinase [Xylariaceae sp. FL0662B]
MFQPQPTPFASYAPYGINIANAEIPEYTFEPTPLAQFGAGAGAGAGHAGGGTGPSPAGGGPTAADIFTSPIFQSHNSGLITANHNNHNNNSHNNNSNNSNTNNIPYNPISVNHHHPPHNHHRSHRNHRNIKMEPQPPPSDLAQQEAAARDYKPQLEGPLVGEKKPSSAIAEEYAKADATYVAKTMALPQTYSHYRPIQGDGNCGWRAIAFAYFETLVQYGDINQLQGELARLTSLNNFIQNVGGHSRWLFEDIVTETFDLFNEIITALSNGHPALGLVMAKFNDPSSSQSIVYHQRLLASSWLKGNYAQYEPWIAGGVEHYIQDTIMPVDREIDHIGVVLLCDVLLKPANMVLEIAYLDRSEGIEVNVHRMPEEANGQDPAVLGPIIYLLYRPGHYDILYRNSIIRPPPIPPAPTTLQINRATSFTHHNEIESTMPSLQGDFTLDLTALGMLPGFEPAPSMSPLASPPAAPSPMTDPYAPSPQSPWLPQHFPDGIPAAPPPQQQPSPPQQQATTPMTIHPLRFSKYNFPDLVETNSFHEPAFTTNTFKNSHFNVAHYNNMNFQPEMYRPDAEEEIPTGKGGGRKRSSDSSTVIKKEHRG